jgi:hypothetical protein
MYLRSGINQIEGDSRRGTGNGGEFLKDIPRKELGMWKDMVTCCYVGQHHPVHGDLVIC